MSLSELEEETQEIDEIDADAIALRHVIEIMDAYATAALTGIVMREHAALLPDSIAQQAFKITKACMVERSAMIQWVRRAFNAEAPDGQG